MRPIEGQFVAQKALNLGVNAATDTAGPPILRSAEASQILLEKFPFSAFSISNFHVPTHPTFDHPRVKPKIKISARSYQSRYDSLVKYSKDLAQRFDQGQVIDPLGEVIKKFERLQEVAVGMAMQNMNVPLVEIDAIKSEIVEALFRYHSNNLSKEKLLSLVGPEYAILRGKIDNATTFYRQIGEFEKSNVMRRLSYLATYLTVKLPESLVDSFDDDTINGLIEDFKDAKKTVSFWYDRDSFWLIRQNLSVLKAEARKRGLISFFGSLF